MNCSVYFLVTNNIMIKLFYTLYVSLIVILKCLITFKITYLFKFIVQSSLLFLNIINSIFDGIICWSENTNLQFLRCVYQVFVIT